LSPKVGGELAPDFDSRFVGIEATDHFISAENIFCKYCLYEIWPTVPVDVGLWLKYRI